MFGFRKKQLVVSSEDAPEVSGPPSPEIKIENMNDNDRPEMKRRYTAPLTNGRSVEVTFKTSWSYRAERDSTGILNQPGGKWLLFRIDSIADQILDPELVPLVEKYVKEMIALDKEYMASGPTEYIDKDGVKWTKVQNVTA